MQLRLFRFEGDIFQKMDFKAFIYQYLDLNYIEADALVETLAAGESRVFEVEGEEAKYSAILSTLGVTFDFGAPKKAAATPQKAEPQKLDTIILEKIIAETPPLVVATPSNIIADDVATLPYMVYYDSAGNLLKVAFSKIFRDCCLNVTDLKSSVEMAVNLLENGRLSVEVLVSQVEDFKKRIIALGGRLVALTPPKKKGKK
jgi:hypothetical protein